MWFLTSKNLGWNFPWSYHQNNYCITKYCTSKIYCFCFKLFALCWGILSDVCLWYNDKSLTARSGFLRGVGMNCWSLFFSCKLQDRIGSSLLKGLYLWITALISLLSVMLSISLLQEFTFGQLIHQLSICPHPETANPAQVCCGFTREDHFPSFPQWTAVAKTQPLALQMCSVTRQSQKVFNSCLPDHSFTAEDSLSFALDPILTFAVPSPSLKHLKQQL